MRIGLVCTRVAMVVAGGNISTHTDGFESHSAREWSPYFGLCQGHFQSLLIGTQGIDLVEGKVVFFFRYGVDIQQLFDGLPPGLPILFVFDFFFNRARMSASLILAMSCPFCTRLPSDMLRFHYPARHFRSQFNGFVGATMVPEAKKNFLIFSCFWPKKISTGKLHPCSLPPPGPPGPDFCSSLAGNKKILANTMSTMIVPTIHNDLI